MSTAPTRRRKSTSKPRYEPVLDLPPLPSDQYEGLKSSIAAQGVLVPILVDGNGPVRRIIDGNHRRRIADELGVDCPEIVKEGLTEQEMRAMARALNLARRQLSQEQKRQIIADQLRETPRRSDRWVARQLGVHHATVGSVRAAMEGTGQIIQCDSRIGADDRCQPAHRLPSTNGKPAPEIATVPIRPLPTSPVDPDEAPEQDDPLTDVDEEAILRRAKEIRQRRIAEEVQRLQKRRRATVPTVRTRRKDAPVLHGDCLDLIPTLEDDSVALVVTSPPYAEQRAGHYEGIPEVAYPEFSVRWMEALRPKLRDDASVMIVIRPNLKDGVISDYVLRTRLALREAGWRECEELIWHKPDAPPIGSKQRPRRTWESILWYAATEQPFCDLTACGKPSDRLGFGGSLRFGVGDGGPIHSGQSVGRISGLARIPDVVVAPVGENKESLDHPAVFPISLAEQLIRTFSQEDDLILDPFCGSGQTLLAAKRCGRRYIGIEREEKYVAMALERLSR